MDFSFDIVSEVDIQEVDNAVNQAVKELSQRFDFKGSKSKIEFNRNENVITIIGDNDFKLRGVKDIFESKIVRRKIDIKAMQYGIIEPSFEGTIRQTVKIQQGIPQEISKEIVKHIKEAKLKVQASIQAEKVRVSSKSKDSLQETITLLRQKDFKIPLQFNNYR